MRKAEWIWKSRTFEPDEYAVFYDTVTYTGEPVKIDISCAGDYALYVNGRLVSFGQYPDYRHDKKFDRVDLTPFLLRGENELRVVAWYIGFDCLTGYDFGAGLIYEVYTGREVLTYSRPGIACGPDPAYVSHRKHLITAQLGYSYTYDTRHAGEKRASAQAVRVDSLPEKLSPRPIEKPILRPFREAKLCDANSGIYDLGRECCGYLSVRFSAPAGETVRIAYGEHLTDGGVRDLIGDRDFSVSLIASGESVDFFGPFRRLGCRYLQIDAGADVIIEEIGLREAEYPFTVREYRAETPLRQKIYDTSVRTLSLCAHDHYEDCPWREQALYSMDSRNQMLCGYYAFENPAAFARASIELILQGQQDSGLFDITFPSRFPFTIPSFSLTLPSVILEYTEHTGDISLAERAMPRLKKLLRFFLDGLRENGLYKTVSRPELWHFYEWAGDLDGSFFARDPAEKERDDYDSLINAFLSIALAKTARLCRMLSDAQTAARYESRQASLNASIYGHFYQEKTGLFKTRLRGEAYSALANALCILCGACPEEKQRQVAAKIARGSDDLLKNTLSMNIFRYDALLTADAAEYRTFILSEIDEVYGSMLRQGATSFWETEKGEADFDGAGSLCHGWSALPVYYYHLFDKQDRKE